MMDFKKGFFIAVGVLAAAAVVGFVGGTFPKVG